MTSLETQGFAGLDEPSTESDSDTSGSRTWRLLVAAATILAVVSLGLLDVTLNGPVGGAGGAATSQGDRAMDGWGKWGGYTP